MENCLFVSVIISVIILLVFLIQQGEKFAQNFCNSQVTIVTKYPRNPYNVGGQVYNGFTKEREKPLEDYWDEVETAVGYASGIAFDGCHKIYVLMDETQVGLMREYEYEFVLTKADLRKDEMLELLHNWYDGSCMLKFIQAVQSVPKGQDDNDGFTTLIPQGAEQEEDEDDDRWCWKCSYRETYYDDLCESCYEDENGDDD